MIELLLQLLVISVLIIGMLIYFAITNCKIELRYRNTLLKEQNESLKTKKNGV